MVRIPQMTLAADHIVQWTKKFGKSKALPEIPKKKFLLVANIAPNFVNERRAYVTAGFQICRD